MNPEPSFDLELYLRVLRRRVWLLLIPIVLLTAILGVGSLLLPNIYLTQAQVVVRPEQDPIKGLAVETQITQQLGGVIESLKRPSQQKQVFEKLEASRPPGTTLQEALTDYRDNLKLVQAMDGNELIVNFLYTGTPEKYAEDVVNTFAETFYQAGNTLVANSIVLSLDFVEEQVAEYRQRLQKTDQQARTLQAKLSEDLGDLAPVSAEKGLGSFLADRLATADNEIQRLNLDIDAGEAKAEYLTNQLSLLKPTLEVRSGEAAGRTQATIEEMLAQAQARRVALLTRYTENHPDVVAATEQLRELEKRAKEFKSDESRDVSDVPNPDYENLQKEKFAVEAELRYNRKRHEQLVANNLKLRKVADRLPALAEDLRRIQGEREALQTTYESLLQRQQSLELNRSFEEGRNTGRFDVRRAGGIPLKPIRPNRRKIAILGLLGGIFIGISFVLLAEYLDHSVRSTDELLRYVDAPVLAVLPRAPN